MKIYSSFLRAALLIMTTGSIMSCEKATKPYLIPGPGAGLACVSSGKNAWETYGVNAFVAVNESIFTNVTNELTASGTTNLGNSFASVSDFAAFKGNLAAFLVYAYGGPASIKYTDNVTYTGPQDMTAAHTGLNITSSQYDYFLTNIVVPALTSNGVPTNDVSSCFAPPLVDSDFKASIINK